MLNKAPEKYLSMSPGRSGCFSETWHSLPGVKGIELGSETPAARVGKSRAGRHVYKISGTIGWTDTFKCPRKV